MNLTTKTIFRISFFSNLIQNKKSCRLISTISLSDKNINILSKNQFKVLNCREASNNVSLLKSKPLPLKRPLKKKIVHDEEQTGFRVAAYSTAEQYNLENLAKALPQVGEFKLSEFNSEFGSTADVVHAVQQSSSDSEGKNIFFFREGAVVMWNVSETVMKKILNFLKFFEENSFNKNTIENEREDMTYSYSPDRIKTGIEKDSVVFSANGDLILEKYAISNAMALSVHLGTYEANLNDYIQTMEPITEDLKMGTVAKVSRDDVLRKTGQLFALRHHINLNSDLLDTPDFYWDREDLENVYQITFNYFCISKRTKVINERINHCIELVELLSSHLNDKHHIRLEWMIIVLIMVEVAFEIVHYVDRYLESPQNKSNPIVT